MSWPQQIHALVLLVLPLLLAACTASNGQLTGGAEAKLVAFDSANPACDLWTDWSRMCSRTGPSGETVCVRDPDRPVSPSEPFCVSERGKAWYERTWTPAQRVSAERFCTKIETVTPSWYQVGADGPGKLQSVTVRGCTEFDAQRPFNGKRVAARRHPWCLAWGQAGYDEVVCIEHGSTRDGSSCSGLARLRHADKLGLFCGERAVPDWCSSANYSADGNFPLPDNFALPNGEDLIIAGTASSLHEQEVVGVYCARSRTQ
jgi:hypothetical protein